MQRRNFCGADCGFYNAVAMSSNLKKRLPKLTGTVTNIEQQVSIYMVTVEIDEEE